ncbi:type III restriction endonuclease subunit R, partial [Candidatus Saccharibacteria bacterium]|nr:type III restriction endonuclease subunit R [Candidatus Saccharibacteria bacterium]
VNINVEELIHRAIEELGEVSISRPQLSNVKTLIEKIDEEGFKTSESIGAIKAVSIDEKRIPDILVAIQNRTMLTRRVIFEILDKSGMFDLIPVNPQQVIDEVSRIINRVKQKLAVDGIKYEKTGEIYSVSLFKDEELGLYLYDAAVKSGAIAVEKPEKTVYDHVIVDSENEREFLNVLEQTENVKFYVKLPSWFKIDTPLGTYNPDWAVVFDGDERIYFVAETKEVDEINDGSLRDAERDKIKAGRKHFDKIGVPFAAPVSSLHAALRKLNVH